MSIFDARHLEMDGEGTELLASVLQPTKRGRAKATLRGRCRAAQAAKGIDVWVQRPVRGEAHGATATLSA
jgi:hypothetical protein